MNTQVSDREALKTGFYVLVEKGLLVRPDYWSFGIYNQEDNYNAIEDYMKWEEMTTISGEKEWLESDETDKCGLKEWLASDDPFKNDPEKCKRVRDYLDSFSILPATDRLRKVLMSRGDHAPLAYKLSEDGKADIDMD
ncbi:MAG: hypothetical protein ACRCTY_04140 [Candidatus Adiutrix sp.]